MKRMRIVSLLLCVVLAAGLFTACGKKQASVNGENEAGSPTAGALSGENLDEKNVAGGENTEGFFCSIA